MLIRDKSHLTETNLVAAVGRVFLGVLVLVTGTVIAIFMSIATFHELFTDDFFGVCVAAMVVVFGVMFLSTGFNLIAGRRPRGADPHPLGDIGNIDRLALPYLPYNHRRAR